MKFRFGKFRQFAEDSQALVTIQMLILSVMIFASVGLMMDFGRAFSAHTSVQTHVDQVALLAAAELDGQDGAITRALAAAAATSRRSGMIANGTREIDVRQIVFLSAAPTGSDGNFDPSMVSGLKTTSDQAARYVLVTSNLEQVSTKLVRFSDTSGGLNSLGVNAFAVAASRTSTCTGTSPLVMCNPFEPTDSSPTNNLGSGSYDSNMRGQRGLRMLLTADNTTGAKPTTSDTKITLGLLKSPERVMDVNDSSICTSTALLPGYSGGATAAEEERLRDICLLAISNAGLGCSNTEVLIKGAHPTTVTTALNVPFDIYDDSMIDAIEAATTYTESHPSSPNYNTTQNVADRFYPDSVTANGRVSPAGFDDWLNNEWATVILNNLVAMGELTDADLVDPAVLSKFSFIGYTSQSQVDQAVLDGDLNPIFANFWVYTEASLTERGIDLRSRNATQYGENVISWGLPYRDTGATCLDTKSCGGSHKAISETSDRFGEIVEYVTDYYKPYLLYDIANDMNLNIDSPDLTMVLGLDADNQLNMVSAADYATAKGYTVDSSNPLQWTDINILDANAYAFVVERGLENFYSLYRDLQRLEAETEYDNASAVTMMDEEMTTGVFTVPPSTSLSATYVEVPQDQVAHTKGSPQNYLTERAMPSDPEERRVKRITVVNCNAAQAYADATGENSAEFADSYFAEVVDTIDVFMLQPPIMTSCATTAPVDPFNRLCDNSDITSVDLDVELIGTAEPVGLGFGRREYAVLIH